MTEAAVTVQADLFLQERPTYEYRPVAYDEVVREPWGVQPSKQLIANVAQAGLIQPVVFVRRDDGLHIREGRRRFQAAEINGLENVPGAITDVDDIGAQVLTLSADLHESKNAIVHLVAIEQLMVESGERDPVELARRSGVPLNLVKKRLKLQTLVGELKDGWMAGQMSSSVGHAAAALKPAQQQKLVKKLRANGELTMADVEQVKRTKVREHQRTLAADRAKERIRDSLNKAKGDAFSQWGDDANPIVEAIDKALALLEEVEPSE